ncbi:hypothetical protein K7X08_013273 [Anisodus acutangulus]|uniref:Uncharacterized protein n=1 Tax=Anisodus acutangulus TaxID=402998 RepID=A0A9Q1MDU3_9SOLA|nr:hypothetical protein K7X08_013273 [Anisodus acutangulus]
MQPESRLLKEVKTEIEDVTLDIIQGGTGEALSPPCTTVVQGTDLSDWLRIRLDEIKDAINYIVDTKKINDEMNMLAEQNEKKNLKSMKVELEKLKSEIQRRESQLNLEMLVTEELSNMINNRAFRIQQFQNMQLMEAFP